MQDEDSPLFDASALEVTRTTDWEHKDGNGGDDCEDATMGGAPAACGEEASFAAGGGSGGNAACPLPATGLNGRVNKIAATTEG